MQKYIQKVCTLRVALPLTGSRYYCNANVAPADPQNVRPVRPVIHGSHGTVDISLSGFPTPLDTRDITSTQETVEFPFNRDMNRGDVPGIGAYILPSSP
jgi:hypothetical protein